MKIIYTTLILCCSQHIYAKDLDVDLNFETRSYSDSLPFYSLANEMNAPYQKGEIAYTQNTVTLGFSKGFFNMAGIVRYDYNLDFNHDGLQLVYNSLNGIDAAQKTTYNPEIRVNHMRAEGLKVGAHYPVLNRLDVGLALSLLRTSDLLYGDINGTATVDNNNNYSGKINLNYAYDQDLLLERKVSGVNGFGYALDLNLNYKPTENLEINIMAKDLASRIRWKKAPYTQATANTATSTIASDGSFNVAPTLLGIESFRTVEQVFPVFLQLNSMYRFQKNIEVGVNASQIYQTYMPELQLGRFNPYSHYGVKYDLKTNGLGVYYSRNKFKFNLLADALDYKKMQKLDLAISYYNQF